MQEKNKSIFEFLIFGVFTGIFGLIMKGFELQIICSKALMLIFKSVYMYAMVRVLVYGAVRSFFTAKDELTKIQEKTNE